MSSERPSAASPEAGQPSQKSLETMIILLPAAILAVDPARWLVSTWRDPAYDSHGLLVATCLAAIVFWSWRSPVRGGARPPAARALWLLMISALVRAGGQISAINILAALTLIVDVYAVALLARLDQRARALSPAWLAVAFAFSMPLERMLQRTLGYGLQQISSDGACMILRSFYDHARCEGTRILLEGRDVLVDLPCSGARTLLLSLLAFVLSATVLRPRRGIAAAGFLLTLASALFANMLRITVLAMGIAFPQAIGGLDVMAEPLHDVIGYLAIGIGLLPLLAWVRWSLARPASRPLASHSMNAVDGGRTIHRFARLGGLDRIVRHNSVALALVAALASTAIVNLPRRAIDIAKPDTSLTVPEWLMGRQAQSIALSDAEVRYFTAFGGAAVKASYGANSLMLVRTTSPLRHLHAPDECLRGSGFDVRYRGISYTPLPTAHYLATSPDGRTFRVDVSFVSDRGHVTGSVAVAVWHWLKRDARQWTAIQRISPIEMPLAEHQAFSAAMLFALGIEPAPTSAAIPQPVPEPIGPPASAPPHALAPSKCTKG